MDDVFNFLSNIDDEHAQLRRPDTLEKGILYETYNFVLQIPDGDKIQYRSLIAYILDEGMKFYVYMPSKYSKLTQERVNDLNAAIEAKSPPRICFYGKMGRANIVEIHKHGQDVDKALISKVERISNLMGNNQGSPESSPKRGSDYPESPAKRFASGSSSSYPTSPRK